jgi:hypothetical protein
MIINSSFHTRTVADTQVSAVVLQLLLISEDYQQQYISNSSKTDSDGSYKLLQMTFL